MRTILTLLTFLLSSLAWAVTPLLAALEFVPAERFLNDPANSATFADLAAGFDSFGIPVPGSWDEVPEGEQRSLLAALPAGLASSVAMYLLPTAPLYPEVLGLDLFDIRQTLEFNEPPEQALVLLGEFDDEAVVAAFEARDYVVAGDSPHLLCPAAGCDTGMVPDLRNRDPANVFGGDLGRRFPVLLSAAGIIGSPSEALLQESAAAQADEQLSLADLPEVRAAADYLYGFQQVRAVTVLHPFALAAPDPARLIEAEPEEREAVLAQLNAAALPPYSLLLLAATTDEEWHYGLTVLVYPDVQTAQAAAEAIDVRLSTLISSRSGVSYAETIADPGELLPVSVEPLAEGLALVAVTVRAPRETVSAGLQPDVHYWRMLNALRNRDHLWLVPGG